MELHFYRQGGSERDCPFFVATEQVSSTVSSEPGSVAQRQCSGLGIELSPQHDCFDFLLQRMFPTQGLNPHLLRLLHCRQILHVEPPGKFKLHVYICLLHIYKYCCCSVAQLCLTLCNPVDCSTQGSSVLHYLPEFAQMYVHRVGDANQPSHPLLPTSPFAFNLSQHQGLFQ